MLHFFLKWKTYRTLKSGLLLDFFVKRVFFNISKFFSYIFTIFFADKFLLEYMFSNFSNFFSILSYKLKFFSKYTFQQFFSLTIFIVSYIFLIFFIIIFL